MSGRACLPFRRIPNCRYLIIKLPLETVLCVELSLRCVPQERRVAEIDVEILLAEGLLR